LTASPSCEGASTDFPGGSLRLRGWLFPLTFPGPIFGISWFPQPRLCGLLWSASYPYQHHSKTYARIRASFGSDSTPRFKAWLPNLITDKPEHPQLLCSDSGSPSPRRRLNLWSRLFPLRFRVSFRPVSFSSVETLRRALVYTLPLPSPPSDFRPKVSLGFDSTPDSFACRCGLELSLFACLTSVHSDQASFDGLFRRLTPLSRLALSTHVSWTRRWPVSFSSVETLRRALVGTNPCQHRFKTFISQLS
jgi:hypothetical protein